jgi:hypothetical protein
VTTLLRPQETASREIKLARKTENQLRLTQGLAMLQSLFTSAVIKTGLLLAAGIFAGYLVIHDRPVSTGLAAPTRNAVNEIEGYRNWLKVNPVPQLMKLQTQLLCARPLSPTGVDVNGRTNPHQEKYITVYVNDIGKNAMMEQARPNFPVGSVIVKEKLPDKSSQSPELLTVMIKREKGFNSSSGDWEYMVVDGKGESVTERGKLENCQSCHLTIPQSDYIFRSYLPYEVRNKLK